MILQIRALALLSLLLAVSSACGDEATGRAAPTSDGGADPGASPDAGQSSPVVVDDLSFTASDGSTVTLSTLGDGRSLVVLVTAAAWCPTCRNNAPRLDEVQQAHPDVRLVTVLYEDASYEPAEADDAAAWARDLGLQHTVVADAPFVVAPYLEPAGREMFLAVEVPSMQLARAERRLSVDDLDQWLTSFGATR